MAQVAQVAQVSKVARQHKTLVVVRRRRLRALGTLPHDLQAEVPKLVPADLVPAVNEAVPAAVAAVLHAQTTDGRTSRLSFARVGGPGGQVGDCGERALALSNAANSRSERAAVVSAAARALYPQNTASSSGRHF